MAVEEIEFEAAEARVEEDMEFQQYATSLRAGLLAYSCFARISVRAFCSTKSVYSSIEVYSRHERLSWLFACHRFHENSHSFAGSWDLVCPAYNKSVHST